jgi:hypothetical protein
VRDIITGMTSVLHELPITIVAFGKMIELARSNLRSIPRP